MTRKPILAALGTAFLLTAGGCLIVSGSSSYETGVKVSRSTLSQIELGKTTEAWLIATLGEPTDRENVQGQDNVQILRYAYRQHESSGGAVLFIFAGGKDKTRRWVAYFEITDGVVTRHWTEG